MGTSASAGRIEAQYIDTQGEVDAVVASLRNSAVVAFDTEFVGERTYRPELFLVQVATPGAIWVIDPLAPLDLSEFWQALTEPGREVVAVAAREEILFCLRFSGRPPALVFDPQIAAGLLGWSYPLSHTNLVREVLGARVNGGETFTDWTRRPLNPAQLAYAADDVRYLLAMREVLLARASSMGRTDWVMDEGTRAVARVIRSEKEERWWRVGGSSGLSRPDLAVLRALWRWRDGRARELNLPARRVLGDDLLVAMVKRKPTTTDELLSLRGLDRVVVRQGALGIIAAVKSGLEVNAEDLPLQIRGDDPPQVAILVQLAAVVANSIAAKNSVSAALLASASDLQELIRRRLGSDGDEEPFLLQGWRREIIGQPLLDLLDGKVDVAVGDIRDARPLIIRAP